MAPLTRRRVAPALRPSLSVPERAPLGQPRPRELWLAVHLPALMLDALEETVRTLPGAPPVAVVDLERNGKVVRACDERVRAAGVHAGMSVNSALALVPTLNPIARNLRCEKQLLEAVARRGLHFTPRVSLEPPDAVVLEVRGSLRLFGGARRLCERLEREIAATTGATVRFAITPTPLASLWLARLHAGAHPVLVRSREELASRLAPLSLGCTRWPDKALQALATMGVRTVGECLRLPRDGFARRFGAEALAMLDRATGRLAEPRCAFAAHERFALRGDLEPEIGDSARLDGVLEPMLLELCRFLRERSRGVQAIEVQLRHRQTPLTRVRLRFVQPIGAQPQRMQALVRERLARLELPEPVRSVRLLSGPLLDLQSEPVELFAHDRRESGENLPQLVERLRARLGHEAVHGLACVEEHRPEAAWRREPSPGLRLTSPASAGEVREPSPGLRPTSPAKAGEVSSPALYEVQRPLWLLEAPEPCDATRLELEDGPECIESGWWDGHDVARDYYVARNREGARLWIFRNRRDTDPAGWFLHGWFA